MTLLEISATNKTPEINFNHLTGKLLIEGWSTPEDSFKFYEPVIAWLVEYEKNPATVTEFNIKLSYYNTSSSKWILEVFYFLERINRLHPVNVSWFYDDEDMLETGQDYSSMVSMPFKFIET
ncbi:MAG: hypothetical protein A2046_08010 [Bacteroidetes bacterium GWA2_30_7]|nr:MAG: hypothetical protein A2046_08010 [Bacteroidetes bacterium GWA2_30_7]